SDVGPPGEIPGGFSFWRLRPARTAPLAPGKAARTSSLVRENGPSRYLHTAANEPRRHLARLSRDGVALGGMMLILKYFFVVGAVLTLGLIALNAHLLPDGSKAPATVIHSPTTASLPTVTPNVPPTDTNVVAEPSQPPPAKSASPARRSHHSARVQRRSH